MNSYNIENYKSLLFALVNQDEGEDNRTLKYGVICVYDMLDNEKIVAIFNNSVTCAKFFNTSSAAIMDNICRKTLRKRRYKIKRVQI